MNTRLALVSIAALPLISASSSAAIVAYWNGESSTVPSDFDASVVTATSFKTGVTVDDTNWGSTDLTYGNFAFQAAPNNGAGLKGKNGNTITFSFTNASPTEALQLNTFHFDFGQAFANSPTTVTVDVGGNGVSESLGFFTHTALSTTGGQADFEDFDLSLSTLGTVAPDDTVTFTLSFSNGATNAASAGLDNIALDAEFGLVLIPEPSAFALLMGLFAVGGLALRRRRA